MKNQYFGDLNDYLKYGMLRAFGRELSIAVVWMMTPDDGSKDGRKLQYLDSTGRRDHDPELFDWIREWKRAGAVKDVRLIEESGLLPNCRFFSEIVPEDVQARAAWFGRVREFSRGADLVFLDPDNGLPVASVRPGRPRWSKYVALEEVNSLYEDGHSVLVYQHYARVVRGVFLRARLRDLYLSLGMDQLVTLGGFDWVGFLIGNRGHGLKLSYATERIRQEWDTAIQVSNAIIVPVHQTSTEAKKFVGEARKKRLDRSTTTPGYVNRNRQTVVRATDLPGTDHMQKVYMLRCEDCGLEYGANGSDIFQRKCPGCQKGATGLAF